MLNAADHVIYAVAFNCANGLNLGMRIGGKLLDFFARLWLIAAVPLPLCPLQHPVPGNLLALTRYCCAYTLELDLHFQLSCAVEKV